MEDAPIDIAIPGHGLVLLVGPSGSGKTTFARRHFRSSEILSSDTFRELVADDENDQSATREAFQALHLVAAARLRRGRLTVVDATNLRLSARLPLLRLASVRRRPVVAIAFDLPQAIVAARNATRTDRHLTERALDRQHALFASALRALPAEGLAGLIVFHTVESADRARVERIHARPRVGPMPATGAVGRER